MGYYGTITQKNIAKIYRDGEEACSEHLDIVQRVDFHPEWNV